MVSLNVHSLSAETPEVLKASFFGENLGQSVSDENEHENDRVEF
jgi:hypothetical protein